MTAYVYDSQTGVYLGMDACQPSPLEPGIFILPSASTLESPFDTELPEDHIYVWSEGKWATSKDPQKMTPVEKVAAGLQELQPHEVIDGDVIRQKTEREVLVSIDDLEVVRQRVEALMGSYLYSTDWYVQRKAETGKDIPIDVLEKRALARDEISLVRVCETVEDALVIYDSWQTAVTA